jgi:hypothetical protein
MSVSSVKLAAWRAEGSLQYLAHELGVTQRHVVRYWDRGWIPGAYRKKRGGHRRVKYTDSTVAQVAQRVAVVKERNQERRYGRRPRGEVLWEARLLRDAILATQGLDLNAVAEDEMVLSLIQIEDLLATESDAAFRRACFVNYREICIELARADERDRWRRKQWRFDSNGWEERVDRLILPLLTQPNLRAFAHAYETAREELTWRDSENPEIRREVAGQFVASPSHAVLFTGIAALKQKHPDRAPTATALAAALSLSRPALYRLYGAKTIRTALNTIRNDAVSISGGRPGEAA